MSTTPAKMTGPDSSVTHFDPRIVLDSRSSVIADYGTASQMNAATKERAMSELRMRQLRLGTPDELPDDQLRVCALAHLLNNRLTIEALGGAGFAG